MDAGRPTNTEILLSEEIAPASGPSHYMLTNRALIRVRLKHLELAIEDVQEANQLSHYFPMSLKSLQIQPSPIGYIAMAIALLGQGDRRGVLCTFDLAIHDCEPQDIRFLLLLKVGKEIEKRQQPAQSTLLREQTMTTMTRPLPFTPRHVLRVTYMKENHGRAVSLFERARNLGPKDEHRPFTKSISFIFGWTFSGLSIAAQQGLFETLYTEERTTEVVEILIHITRTSDGVIQGSKETAYWIAGTSRSRSAG
ncbi:hypothetical protein EDC04DRAFT_2901237 [Pisolithus marmoratus]|nr:hypothetical protein EDC04DRAFT_2901237 [Pisolithus marmoratus]